MGASQDCCCQCLCPCSEPQLPPTSAGDPPILAGRSGPLFLGITAFLPPGSWCAWDFVCALQEWSFCFSQSCGSPAMKPCWAFKGLISGDSSSCCRAPRLGSLTWGSELSLLWDNFRGIIVFQFEGHPPGEYGIWFYHDCAPPISSLWHLLCLWM